MSVDDRELLWAAWPDGYLAMRGVMTVAGWQCIGVATDKSLWFPLRREGTAPILGLPSGGPPYEQRSSWRADMDPFRLAADMGDLLPDIDPTDTATWACLKADLARAAGAPDLATEISWTSMHMAGAWHWTVSWHEDNRRSQAQPFDSIETKNPGLALLMARIQLRRSSHVD